MVSQANKELEVMPPVVRVQRRLAKFNTAMEYLDVSRTSLYRLFRSGELTLVETPVGGRVDLDEVDAKIKEWSNAAKVAAE